MQYQEWNPLYGSISIARTVIRHLVGGGRGLKAMWFDWIQRHVRIGSLSKG